MSGSAIWSSALVLYELFQLCLKRRVVIPLGDFIKAINYQ